MQIIPKNDISVETHWQKELSQSFTTIESLYRFLELPLEDLTDASKARKLFPMRVPIPFANQMERGNINDPLLQQVLPSAHEFNAQSSFIRDPLQEQNSVSKGILHKYQNRVLLIVRGGCAVNCRYCFRRHFPYQDNSPSKNEWLTAFKYIEEKKNIEEVILSGGDPLMANDDFLEWMVNRISEIKHIERLRIHTRLPVVIPNRINNQMIKWLSKSTLTKTLVFHINHANELGKSLTDKLPLLKEANVNLLNQTVLLKNINDSSASLKALNKKLYNAGIMPYYLHILDKVEGAAHFDVSLQRAKEIMKELVESESGYLIPKLVQEHANRKSKTPIDLGLE